MDAGPPKYEEVVEMYDESQGIYYKKRDWASSPPGRATGPSASAPLLQGNELILGLNSAFEDLKSAIKIVKQPITEQFGKTTTTLVHNIHYIESC
jgi:hypothetical protein